MMAPSNEKKDSSKLTNYGADTTTPPESEIQSSNREIWGSKAEFILACIGLAVGLGNIWRFPYLCQKNGGGAFLIPYFTMMIFEGLPMFLLELAVGQRFRKSGLGAWSSVHPALKGVGVACMVVSAFTCVYYICIMAWSLHYLFDSFKKTLPWSTDKCPRYDEYHVLEQNCSFNITCPQLANFSGCCVRDPPLYYFYREVLNISPSVGDTGTGMQWDLLGYLFLAWVVTYLCVVKGIRSSGKVVYVTATLPYLLLIIMFCFGITLDGAGNGLKALFTPDFSKLSDPQIWLDAASQMFFSLCLGYGTVISFSSYNKSKNNCIYDTFTIVLINCGTSIFAGTVIYSILGHRQLDLGQDIHQIGSGPGLAFITFCDAFLSMPIPQLWSAFFFLTLLLLGIDSQFGTLEGFIAPFYDEKLVRMRKEVFTGIVAIIFFLIGASIMSSSGYFVFQIFDSYSLSIGLVFIGLFQSIAIAWVYGNDRLADDIEEMTGTRPNLFWMVCWKYITPAALTVILIASFYNIVKENPSYKLYVGCLQQEHDFSPISPGVDTSTLTTRFPPWATLITYVFMLLPVFAILGWLMKDFFSNTNKWISNIKNKLGTLAEWHPDPSRIDSSKRKMYSAI